MAVLKAGVIGAGVFGGYHAGKYAAHADTQLCAIYDVIKDAADAAAQKHGAKGFDDLDAFLSAVDIVTLASPAQTHFDMARACLLAGKPVLIEKPIADTAQKGAQIVALAKKQGCIIAVDHQERAVAEAIGLLSLPETPTHITAVRKNTWSPRGSDVSVTLDLMTHDLDLMCALLGDAGVEKIRAKARREKSEQIDEITTQIDFDGGAQVTLTASRIADERERGMEIIYPSGKFRIDFITREFTNDTPFALNPDFTQTPQGQDPLGYSVSRFIAAVKTGDAPVLVTGEDGVRALDLAEKIDAAALAEV